MSIASVGSSDAVPTVGEDFPIICQSCLGPNPYVRMLKDKMGKACKISGRPFNSFRWQGEHKRWKETCIASEVAREKNVCQACVCDLEYGVPFHVRDHVMQALGEERAPESDTSKEYYWAEKRQKLGDGTESGLDTYERLRENVETLRTFAALDPGPVLRPKRDSPLTPEEQDRLRQKRLAELRPPADQTIKSLYIGSVPPAASRKELYPYFLAYGPVRDLVLDPKGLSAVVTYESRDVAEKACKALNGNLQIRNTRVRVMWARKRSRNETVVAPPQRHAGYGSTPPPPPGVAGASSRPPLPPGVSPPPGVKPGAAYPSMNPDALGARPDKD